MGKIKRKRKAYVDKRLGKYRVQVVETTKHVTGPWAGRSVDEFLYKKTFNKRKDAESYAKKIRHPYKTI